MTMPGFTAHNSLCRSSQHYISGFFSSWSPPGTVVPSVKPYDPDDGGDCHVTCGQCSHNCMTTCQNSCYPDDAPYSQPCCDSTETCCSGKCINTKSDTANCGACGNVCTNGNTCSNGVCRCLQTLCGKDCVDLSSDRYNCGACGIRCPIGQFCCSGTCSDTYCGEGCCPKGTQCCNTTLYGWNCCPNKCNHIELFGVSYTYCT